jgi:hypothetical protein
MFFFAVYKREEIAYGLYGQGIILLTMDERPVIIGVF